MLRQTTALLLATAIAVCSSSAETRSYTGHGNNLANSDWGAQRTNFVRMDPVPRYDDGFASPTIANRPNPRDVSNVLAAQTTSVLDPNGRSDFVWQWGQFIDHDMTLTRKTTVPMHIDVTSPTDPLFPFIPMFRSDYDFFTGTGPGNPREHYNENSSFLDASMVYGSDEARAIGLRTMSDGKLKMSDGNLMVRNVDRFENENPGDEPHPTMFLGGDIRVNEQHGLIAIHTLFAREHNRVADIVASQNPTFDDEQIYQRARKIVGGIVQHITYNEYLPALTGDASMLSGASYDSTVDATIANEFATAAYRLGHTQVSPTLARIDNDGNVAPGGPRTIPDSFFTPSLIDSQEIDYLLKGLSSQTQQATDLMIVDELRNQLFGMPDVPSGGLDLLAININRGRDHGLSSLTELQQSMGLPVASSFADVTSDPLVQADLASLYSDVSEIDLWVGLMAEDKLPGSTLGYTMQHVVLDQFERLLLGDRFFYLWDDELTAADRDLITSMTLSEVILANSGITNLQGNAFFVPEPSAMMMMLGCVLIALRTGRSARTSQ